MGSYGPSNALVDTSAHIDPPHLPWLVYAYGPDGYAQECPVGHNTNVTVYTVPDGMWVMSLFSFLSFFLSILAS